MRPLCILTALSLLLPVAGEAQRSVRYEISFPNRAHHEAEVTVVFPDLDPGPLEIRMSRSSPGRYALHEFAKNVYNFRATGVGGRAVVVRRPDVHQWTVSEHGGEVRVSYTLYADRADGTYAGVDRTHAHLNIPATFVWARGMGERPVRLIVHPPEGSGWRVATQLVPTDDPFTYTAPNLAYFMDSPTEVSDFKEMSWEVDGPSGPQTVRIALHHDGSEEDARRYADAVRSIVETERDVYGELPAFDYGTYTFLACYLPWVDGDGMEHRNSTSLTSRGNLADNLSGLVGTVAHEFFHAWNMERIRSAALEPFDLERANPSEELWFGEGFTSYYTMLVLWRAGLIDDEAFASRLTGSAGYVQDAPGRRFFSPVEMSRQAPFVDAAVSVDPTNRANTFISYYTWGSVVGMGLDLELRTRFADVGLDDVMREMWRSHGSPEIPYSVDDVQAAVARVTGDEDFAGSFFRRYVRGREAPDFVRLLEGVGIVAERVPTGHRTLGAGAFRPVEGGVVVARPTLIGSALYDAGVDRGDVILGVDGRGVADPEALQALLDAHAAGDDVLLRVRSRGATRDVRVRVDEGMRWRGRPLPPAELTPDQARRREAWRRPG